MGDRANILVVDEPAQNGTVNGIYLYTHWSGYRWPETLRTALDSENARRRWRDESYLTRIIVSQVFSDIHEEETGGGISTVRTDNSYPITILDIPKQRVAWADQGDELDTAEWYGHMTFAEFCAQDTAQWPGEYRERED